MKAEEVGYRIAQARKKQGMTQRELSERLHVSDKAVSKWERGVNYPDISLFDEIAKTLDLSLVELLGIEDRSKEEIVQNISEISKYEKEKIGKEIYQRGFVTIICGMIVLAGQLSAALIFAQNEVPGAGILCTSGMMCFTGLMIANGLYTISHAKSFTKQLDHKHNRTACHRHLKQTCTKPCRKDTDDECNGTGYRALCCFDNRRKCHDSQRHIWNVI